MKLVVDSYSWINYLEGDAAGDKVRKYIEDEDNEIVTNILNLAEISSYLGRKELSHGKIEETLKIIRSLSKIFNFDSNFSERAGILHSEIKRKIRDFGLVDAFVLLAARELNAKVLTGDEHFRDMKEAILVK